MLCLSNERQLYKVLRFTLQVKIDLPVLQYLWPSHVLDRSTSQQQHCLSPGRKGRPRRRSAGKHILASKIIQPVNFQSISDWKTFPLALLQYRRDSIKFISPGFRRLSRCHWIGGWEEKPFPTRCARSNFPPNLALPGWSHYERGLFLALGHVGPR